MIVTSFFPGRIRLRSKYFLDEEIYSKAFSLVQKYVKDALLNIQKNETTASVLIEYDVSKVDVTQFENLKDFLFTLNTLAEKYNEKNRVKILELLEKIERE